jgi:hypothetical protein
LKIKRLEDNLYNLKNEKEKNLIQLQKILNFKNILIEKPHQFLLNINNMLIEKQEKTKMFVFGSNSSSQLGLNDEINRFIQTENNFFKNLSIRDIFTSGFNVFTLMGFIFN